MIWQKGEQLLQKNLTALQKRLPALYLSLEKRFALAGAWCDFLAGRMPAAHVVFTSCLAGPAEPGWLKQEAKLGLALLAWKDNNSIEEIVTSMGEHHRNNYYWLAGHKVDFYRLAARRKHKDNIERLCKQSESHRVYFTLIDALCLLGDGRAAYALLGQVIERYPEAEVRTIYLAEQKNIPGDAYADNQIWEKLE